MDAAFNAAVLIAGGVVLGLGLVAGYFKNRWWVGESTVCILLGTVLGPHVTGLADPARFPADEFHILEEIARLTLAIAVMAAALRLPRGYFFRAARSAAMALGPLMLLAWAASAGLGYAILGQPLLGALALGAALVPTDPVVASAVVNGKIARHNLPARLRHLLTAESGANDGLALLFVMLPVLLLNESAPTAWSEWLIRVLVWQILGGALLGLAAGWTAGRVFEWARKQPVAEKQSLMTIALALSVTVLAATKLAGSDGILAAFTAGASFSRTLRRQEEEQEHLQEAVERFFDLPVFVLIGIMLPWPAWIEAGWSGVLFCAAILLLRRPLFWLGARSLIPELKNTREAAFAGWFGPVGVSTVYYLVLIRRETGIDAVWETGAMVVFASVLVFSICATPLTGLFGKARADS